ncbi:MAG: amidase family protein, partial [Halobacteria archaeon]|nr:amidase family protein [Halobacteria archaeon]
VKRRVMLGTYALSAGYYGKYYQKAQNARELVRRDINDAFEDADVLASPTMPVKPFRIGETIDDPMQMYLADVNTVPVNLAGVPSISLPAGRADGLPVGLQLIGPKFDETQLLRTGKAFLN